MTEGLPNSSISIPRPFERSYWVIPGRLLAGEYPGSLVPTKVAPKLTSILRCGVNAFIDLTCEGELEPYFPVLEGLGANPLPTYRRMPIVDFSIPSEEFMRLILDELDRALQQERCVYLHCWGGSGRTGTVVGCYFVRQGLSGEAALRRIRDLRQVIPRDLRRPSPETAQQSRFVRDWKE